MSPLLQVAPRAPSRQRVMRIGQDVALSSPFCCFVESTIFSMYPSSRGWRVDDQPSGHSPFRWLIVTNSPAIG